MDTQIIKCELKDLEDIKNIGYQTYYETYREGNSLENLMDYLKSAFTDEQILEELNNKNSVFYLVYLDGLLVGYLKLNVLEEKYGKVCNEYLEIERIYIKKEYQKLGLGKKLLNISVNEAKKLGREKICIDVREYNYGALEFFKKQGFVKVESQTCYMGRNRQIDYVIELKIKEC